MNLNPALVIVIAVCSLAEGSLYNSDDHIVLIDKTNITETLFEKQNFFLVEFYSSWCGHCIRYAPIFKQFALEVKAWQKVAKLAAVDCAADINMPVCREFDIQFYPTLKFFPVNSKSGFYGEPFTVHHDVTLLKNELAKTLLEKSPEWRTDNRVRLPADLETTVNYALIMCGQSTEVILAYQLMLDLSDYEGVEVRWVNWRDANNFGVLEYPSLVIRPRGGSNNFKILAGPRMSTKFLDSLREYMAEQPNMADIPKIELTTLAPVSRVSQNSSTNRFAAIVHEQDLESNLHYSLRREVAGSKIISGEKLAALKAYVSLLSKYYPGRKVVTAFLGKLSTWLNAQTGDISGEIWLTSLNSLQSRDAYLPSQLRWAGCRGSAERYRGYPCSLWTMFHSLTVNCALASSRSSEGPIDSQQVITVITNYLSNFFGCRECATHFVAFAQKQPAISTPDDSVLFLWRAHNTANRRLHGDLSEDPEYPKMQFPSIDLCWSCYNVTAEAWNFDQVLLYLKTVYSPAKLIRDASGSYELAFSASKDVANRGVIERDVGGSDGSANGMFSGIDVGLCLMLYIACMVFLLVAFIHVRLRRRKASLLPTIRRC